MTAQYLYDDILDMLPAFALGALEADEMLAVEEFLRTNGTPELLAHLETLEDSAAMLALEAPAQPLPLHVKGQLFDAIAAELTALESQPASVVPRSVKTSPPHPQAQLHSEESALARWWSLLGGWLRPVAWVAVGALLAFFLIQTVNPTNTSELITAQSEIERLQGELQNTQQQVATLQTDLQEAQTQNDTLQQVNQSLQSQLNGNNQQLAVLAGATHTIPLAGQEAAPAASGALYVGQGESLLILSGLDVLPDDQTYQLWLIPAEGSPLPSGLLAVQQSDVDSLTITLPDEASRYAAVGVSIEPAGGSDAPTGPIVLVGLTSS